MLGVILTIALLTLPAVIARHWTDQLGTMIALASAICAAVFASGLFLAYDLTGRFDADIPTGPVIILIGARLYAVSASTARSGDSFMPPSRRRPAPDPHNSPLQLLRNPHAPSSTVCDVHTRSEKGG